jgi:hypothetical protein
MDGSKGSSNFLGEAAAGSTGLSDAFDAVAFDEYFGLCTPDELVVIRPYNGDEDDRVLDELRPRYIIMYDPDPAFVRRIEVRLVTLLCNVAVNDLTWSLAWDSVLSQLSSRHERPSIFPSLW